MKKYCWYCEKTITSNAVLVPDDGERGTHALTYAHRLGDAECVKDHPLTHALSVPHVGGVPVTPRRRLRTRGS